MRPALHVSTLLLLLLRRALALSELRLLRISLTRCSPSSDVRCRIAQGARPYQSQMRRLTKSANAGFFAEMQSIQPGLRLQSKTPLSSQLTFILDSMVWPHDPAIEITGSFELRLRRRPDSASALAALRLDA